MATFKKFDNQQVYKLKTAAAVNLKTGDVISYDHSAKTATKVTTMEAAETAFASNSLYIVAQSDAITYNNGTGYKTAKLVGMDEVKGNTIVAYFLVEVAGLPLLTVTIFQIPEHRLLTPIERSLKLDFCACRKFLDRNRELVVVPGPDTFDSRRGNIAR